MKYKLFILVIIFVSCDQFIPNGKPLIENRSAYIYTRSLVNAGLYYIDLEKHEYTGNINSHIEIILPRNQLPAITKDGKNLFVAGRNKSARGPSGTIFTIDLLSRNLDSISDFPYYHGFMEVQLIPGTTHLVTIGRRPSEGNPTNDHGKYFIVKIDQTTMSIIGEIGVLHDIESPYTPQFMSVSPDGRWGAFTSLPLEPGILHAILTVVDLERFEIAANFDVSVIPLYPVFTGDSRLLYARSTSSLDAHVYRVDLSRMDIEMIYDYRPENLERYFPDGALIPIPNSGEMLFSYHLSPRQLDLWEGISPHKVVRFNEQGEIVRETETGVFQSSPLRTAIFDDSTFCILYHPKAVTSIDESVQFVDASILYVSTETLEVIKEETIRLPRDALYGAVFIIP